MEFTVEYREHTGKGVNRKLRQKNFNPGVIYGKDKPFNVQMLSNKALAFIQSFKGAHKPFNLNVQQNGSINTKKVIIQDYQMTNFAENLIHVDFLEVDDDTIVKIDMPIITVGESQDIKLGGLLQFIRHTIPVKCAIKNIPEKLQIDITNLKIGKSVHVLDIEYPEGVSPVVTDRNYTVLTLTGNTSSNTSEEETEETQEEEK